MRGNTRIIAPWVGTTLTVFALSARPAAAVVYMRSKPPESLMYLKLASLASPHAGRNQTGTALALIVDPRAEGGFRVIRSGMSCSREGNKVTIDLGSMNIAGSSRLYGTLRGTRLALDIPSDGGEIAQQVYNAVSEAEWNRVAARFKSFAGFVRQVQVLLDQRSAAHEEWARLKAADDAQKAELADPRKQLGPAKEQQRDADGQLARADAALASGERKHAAAEAVAKAAAELAEACYHCRTVDEAQEA